MIFSRICKHDMVAMDNCFKMCTNCKTIKTSQRQNVPCFEICSKKQTALIGMILNVHNVLFFNKFVTAFVSDGSLLKSIHRLCFISNKYYFCEQIYAMRILLTFFKQTPPSICRRSGFSTAPKCYIS